MIYSSSLTWCLGFLLTTEEQRKGNYKDLVNCRRTRHLVCRFMHGRPFGSVQLGSGLPRKDTFHFHFQSHAAHAWTIPSALYRAELDRFWTRPLFCWYFLINPFGQNQTVHSQKQLLCVTRYECVHSFVTRWHDDPILLNRHVWTRCFHNHVISLHRRVETRTWTEKPAWYQIKLRINKQV